MLETFVDVVRSRGNPFLEAEVDLVKLDGRISNAKDVSAIYDKGKYQYYKFVNDVIVNRNTPLNSPIKINGTRFGSSKSRSDARGSNRRFLYSKQVSHSSAKYTLRLPRDEVIIVTWKLSSHKRPTR